jgi:hypothetical protein
MADPAAAYCDKLSSSRIGKSVWDKRDAVDGVAGIHP